MLKQTQILGLVAVFAFGCRTRDVGASANSSSGLAAIPPGNESDWQRIGSDEFALPNPPKEGSEDFKKDFEILHQQQDSRSDADCAMANSQKLPTFEAFFGPKTKKLSVEDYNRISGFMQRVTIFAEGIANYFKTKYERMRPYEEDKTLKPCVAEPSGERSYPSSHATAAAVDACILARIFPDKADELIKYGEHLGNLRYIAGVHHPSDVVAGQQLGKDICESLLSDSSFMREMKALND